MWIITSNTFVPRKQIFLLDVRHCTSGTSDARKREFFDYIVYGYMKFERS